MNYICLTDGCGWCADIFRPKASTNPVRCHVCGQNMASISELSHLRKENAELREALAAVISECRVPACTPGGRWHQEYYDAFNKAEHALASQSTSSRE